jgi:hypothetical protein
VTPAWRDGPPSEPPASARRAKRHSLTGAPECSWQATAEARGSAPSVEFLLEDAWRPLVPGQFLHVPRGTIHTFRNATTDAARMLSGFVPAGFERFFRDFGHSCAARRRRAASRSGRRDPTAQRHGKPGRHGDRWRARTARPQGLNWPCATSMLRGVALPVRGPGLDDGDAVGAVAGRDGGRRPEGARVDDRQRVCPLVGHVEGVGRGPYGERVRAVGPDGDG